MTEQSEHPLDTWQVQLADNFDDVALRKWDLPQEPVTFALEHGLSESERESLKEAIHASMDFDRLYQRHYLCWAVYAAEIGYLFAGDEYWHTYEEQTPGWLLQNRPFIKSCFQSFAQEYKGAIPRGPWARHRSIICWPITHSILPKDLQRQLAEILYRIRYSVVMEDVESPRQLGRLIARHSDRAAARFRQLCSEPDLIGQIAAALLLEDQELDLIESRTLKRLAADLSAEEQARSWLHDARRHLSRRATIKGLSRRPRTTPPSGERHSPPPRPPLRPRMLLRNDQGDTWRVLLDVPDLTPLVRTYPDLQLIVSKAQIRVGTFQRPVQARTFLHGSQSFVQTSWPTEEQPLLVFEPSHRDLDALLGHACRLESGPWLFRVGIDGIARENRSRRVTDGGDYIVVGSRDLMNRVGVGKEVELICGDVAARRFEATDLDELTEALMPLGLAAARKVSASPAGLVPASWDREGTAEWLSTDRPMISLSSNYSIDHFDLILNVGTEDLALVVRPDSPADDAIVQLPELNAGVYHLSVTAYAVDSRYPAEHGDLEIVIRDPLSGDGIGRTAMMVVEEPREATLEDLFEGRLQIQIVGPDSRDVTATIRLLGRRRIAPLAERVIQGIHLPMTTHEWARRLSGIVDQDVSFAKAYQEATSCELIFDGGDLGVHVSAYDRPFTPLRWGVTHERDALSITLFDDTDDPEEIEVVRYEFSTPQIQRRVTNAQRQKASRGEAAPGLYVARAGSHIASTVVPMQSIELLRAARPRFRRPERTHETVAHFLDSIDAWGHVSTTGNVFGRFAWRQSLIALIQQLAGLIGGTAWYKAELEFHRVDAPNVQSLANRIPFKKYGCGWEEQLPMAIVGMLSDDVDGRVGRLSKIVGTTTDECQFALQMASDPTDIRKTYDHRFGHMLNAIMHKSEIFRAARFSVLATSHRQQGAESDFRNLYPGWIWN